MSDTNDKTPREYTAEETRDMLLKHIHSLVDYWDRETRVTDTHAKLSGLAFSICSALDGGYMNLPGFTVLTNPHPSDKEYCQRQGGTGSLRAWTSGASTSSTTNLGSDP